MSHERDMANLNVLGDPPQKKRGTINVMAEVLSEVGAERVRQDQKWGVQNHPDLGVGFMYGSPETARAVALTYGIPEAEAAKEACREAFAPDTVGHDASPNWLHVLVEEVAETAEATCKSSAELRAELVQTAAVCVAWIECLDRRASELAKAAQR